MDHSQPNRRSFLRGASGAALALPYLPSLDGDAHAQGKAPKRFLFMGTYHGAVKINNMYPATLAASPVQILPGFNANVQGLVPAESGSTRVLSPVLTAPASVLNDSVLGKMNVLFGIDHPIELGHSEGGFLGNNAQTADPNNPRRKRITIDQVMAYSPAFYRNGDGMKLRSIHVGEPGTGVSATYTDPVAKIGVQRVAPTNRSLDLFDRLFMGNATTNPVAARRPIIDRVLQNYRSLVTSNRRLSQEDRLRLNAHISRLAEIETQLTASAPISCTETTRPTTDAFSLWNASDVSSQRRFYQLFADVIAAAFACGLSRVAVVSVGKFMVDAGALNWHQDIAHQAGDAGNAQNYMVAYNQQAFEHVFLHAANRLDSITDADGKTVLDNTLLMWGNECGEGTHGSLHMPIVTAGSAGGFFKTKMFVDYRNQNARSQHHYSTHAAIPGGYCGLVYPQLLATTLDAMGIPRSEWEADQPSGLRGYGEYEKDVPPFQWGQFTSLFAPGVYDFAGEKLPIIT